MCGASEATLLGLWDSGQTRHPIDRALLLCAWARPELASDALAQLPLGAVNAALLRMRAALFGPSIEVQLDCEHCGEALELHLTTDQLLAQDPAHEALVTIDVDGYPFRLPDSRDLAAIAPLLDSEHAAMQLLERCCLRQDVDAAALGDVQLEVEGALEQADPLADVQLDVACHACGARNGAGLDVGALLWNDIQRHARALLEQVHILARNYGWTEGDVLALSAQRRAAYLDLTTG